MVHRLFEARAAASPDAPAVLGDGMPVNYAELDARADAVARSLRSMLREPGRGDGPPAPHTPGDEPVIAVRLPRGAGLVTALLAAAKSGAAYLPLDPGLPPERTRALLESAGARLVISDRRRLPDAGSTDVLGTLPLLDLSDDAHATPPAAGDGPAAHHDDYPGRLAYLIHTSGSTGRPKPVAVEHRSLANHAQAVRACFGLTETDRVLQFTNPGFDVLGEEVFPTLAAGGAVVVLDDTTVAPDALAEFIRDHRVTVANLPTPYWAQWCTELDRAPRDLPPTLRLLVIGSDTARTHHLAAWRRHSAVPVINAYGLTETTITATTAFYPPDAPLPDCSTLPIGTPLDGVDAHVLGPAMEPCPPGTTGELFIGGQAVARGYPGRPGLTAQRFVPDPFAARPGARLYRTGDLARRTQDGSIEFLGRDDHQVKIRGHRVEPAETEAVLAGEPGVRECAVVPHRSPSGDVRLIAYVVGEADPRRLREAAARTLPDYAVPAAYVTLPALPVTPQGKLDRAALPAPRDVRDGERPYARPEGPDEERLAALWGEVLGVDRVGRTDDFFALGGDSLHMTRILGRLTQTHGTRITAREFMAARTVRDLAARLGGSASGPAAARRCAAPADAVSHGEQRLWFLAQLKESATTAYNVPSALRLRGDLDVAALEQAVRDVVGRHERLRTTFHFRSGRLVAEIADDVPPLALQVIDLGASGDGESAALKHAEEFARRPFDLTCAPLLRAALIGTAPGEHLLVLVTHHIVSDGVSSDLLDRELALAYAHRTGQGPAPATANPHGYREFIRAQRELAASPDVDALVGRVVDRLRGAPTTLALPTDHPRPRSMSYRGDQVTRATPAGLRDAVARLAAQEGTTPYSVVLTALGSVLRDLCGQDELLIGSPTAGRADPAHEDVIGFFVNTVVLRLDFRGTNGFRDALLRTHSQVLDAIEDEYAPFDRLVPHLVTERGLAVPPLVQVALAYQGPRRPEARLAGIEAAPVPLHNGGAKFDLTLEVEEVDGEMVTTAEYSTDLFRRDTVRNLLDSWVAVLAAAVIDYDGA
ncbi:hypothetical protein DEJ47_24955 [Streptomyces venezuelae]|uniref:Carrier domain-containing protein n=4 Tax=Streptomyces TaxID=1883 RepID=A0A5P2BHQ1_STRVZ|nr:MULTISPECIES: amino acid adenylation domain-containing protein [unclassified Streptomyces]QES29248.1 hypothetical protein DEJ47_24955 [Streptomyces venezuelae]